MSDDEQQGDATDVTDADNGVSTDASTPSTSGDSSTNQDNAIGTSAKVSYAVELVAQPDKASCWAGSMAMLVGFRRSVSIPPEQVAEEAGQTLRRSYGWDELEAVRDHFGFQAISLPSGASLYYDPTQWHDWLASYGPLWVTTVGNPSHAIIVAGIHGDMTPDGTTVEVMNPWDTRVGFDADPIDFHPANEGYQYSQSFADFAADFGNVGLSLPLADWRVLYLQG
jgi:hypothetical protein